MEADLSKFTKHDDFSWDAAAWQAFVLLQWLERGEKQMRIRAMMLYKYLPANFAIMAIEHKRLKVSQLNDLNDIYDCKPRTIYDEKLSSDTNNGFRDELRKQVTQDIGINCYCREKENLLLWSHYGDSHRGMAPGFELKERRSQPSKSTDPFDLDSLSGLNIARKTIERSSIGKVR
jgi:hypothetical protein